MSLLLHVSDTHFGTEQAPVVEALLRLATEQRPDVLVLSGDVTQRATAAQFEAARRFIDRLGIARRVVIPGNHDIPLFAFATRLLSPYARWRRAMGNALEGEVEMDDCLVIGINTTRWYRHQDGEVSPAQIEQVAARLARAGPGALRVVVVHQPVAVTRDDDRANLLIGHEQAIRAWSAAGADLILGGHIHLPFIVALDATGRAAARACWCVQAGTAVSSRLRAGLPNSVNLIRTGPAGATSCSVERWDFDGASGRFECHRVQQLARGSTPPADAPRPIA